MATEQQYSCGENTYYVVHRNVRLFVERRRGYPAGNLWRKWMI